jgi:hypothetical protein
MASSEKCLFSTASVSSRWRGPVETSGFMLKPEEADSYKIIYRRISTQRCPRWSSWWQAIRGGLTNTLPLALWLTRAQAERVDQTPAGRAIEKNCCCTRTRDLCNDEPRRVGGPDTSSRTYGLRHLSLWPTSVLRTRSTRTGPPLLISLARSIASAWVGSTALARPEPPRRTA